MTEPKTGTRTIGVARWENEGGRSATERPRLYADLLAEADRRRRVSDAAAVQPVVAPGEAAPEGTELPRR